MKNSGWFLTVENEEKYPLDFGWKEKPWLHRIFMKKCIVLVVIWRIVSKNSN